MANLTSLPPEILHQIFWQLSPAELTRLPPLCRSIRAFLDGNFPLYREVYLSVLDTPTDCSSLNWAAELHDFVRLQEVCLRWPSDRKQDELAFVEKVVARLLQRASPASHSADDHSTAFPSRNVSLLTTFFQDQKTREAFLQRSFLFERFYRKSSHMLQTQSLENQRSAKLHCLYGVPVLNLSRLRSTKTYPFAASKVYDLRQYNDANRWGPFLSDDSGRVDWEKMEAIFIVLGYNVALRRLSKLFSDVWETPFCGSWPKSYFPSPWMQPSLPEDEDPYGITGVWYRVVCFLDYNDLFSYNFPISGDVPDDAPRPSLHVGEATRLILMHLHVTDKEPPGPEDGQGLPVVHFEGLARSVDDAGDDADSSLRGTVRLTKEGEVRWTTLSIFNDEERYRSEGIQVGGIKSARGVLGTWFDKDYDTHGPVGPTAFWKASEGKANMTLNEILPTDLVLTHGAFAMMDESDPEAEMDYEDDEDEDDIDEMDMEPISNELPGLLQDAQREVAEIVYQAEHAEQV